MLMVPTAGIRPWKLAVNRQSQDWRCRCGDPLEFFCLKLGCVSKNNIPQNSNGLSWAYASILCCCFLLGWYFGHGLDVVSAIALILAEIWALKYFTKVARIKAFWEVLSPLHTRTIHLHNIFISYVHGVMRVAARFYDASVKDKVPSRLILGTKQANKSTRTWTSTTPRQHNSMASLTQKSDSDDAATRS